MCDKWCLEVVEESTRYWPKRAKVLEVGGLDVNGSSRSIANIHNADYYSVDMREGRNVDRVVAAENLIATFDVDYYDVVISTEMLEHAKLWRESVFNMLSVTKPQGILVLTTRSKGFIRHGYPEDYWRFEVEDLKEIFASVGDILYIGKDREEGGPGCGIILRRTEPDLKTWKEFLKTVNVHDINTEA